MRITPYQRLSHSMHAGMIRLETQTPLASQPVARDLDGEGFIKLHPEHLNKTLKGEKMA